MVSTVLLPSNGNPSHMNAAIDSVFVQSTRPNLLVVIENGDTPAVIEAMIERFQLQVKGPITCTRALDMAVALLINNPSKNFSSLLNAGISFCINQCDAIFIVEPGSWMADTRITDSLEILEKFPFVSCILSDTTIHLPNNQTVRRFFPCFDVLKSMGGATYDNNMCIRSKVLQSVGPFHDQLGLKCCFEMLLRCCKSGLPYHLGKALNHSFYREETQEERHYEMLIRQQYLNGGANEQQ